MFSIFYQRERLLLPKEASFNQKEKKKSLTATLAVKGHQKSLPWLLTPARRGGEKRRRRDLYQCRMTRSPLPWKKVDP